MSNKRDLVAGKTTHNTGKAPKPAPAKPSKPASGGTSGNFFLGSGKVTFKGRQINGDKNC